MNGFNGFEKKMKEIDAATVFGLEVVGKFVEDEYILRLGAHVRTGNLIGSPTHKVQAEQKAVRVGTNVDYAGFLEHGTSRSRPYPCLRPAVDDNTEHIKQLFKESVGGVL